RGADHYNKVKGTTVKVLGWDVDAQDGSFTGSFTDMGLARQTAESQFQEGCDISIPVGGAINLPAGDAINDLGLDAALIGVDADAYFAMDAQYQPVWLTTVEKAIAPFVALSIQEQAEGTWAPGAFVGDLNNDGVGLSDYHDWDSRVSPELKAEVEQVLQDIKDGVIKADYTPVGY
ncbi:MAG: BMP family ABC transporter substrate-binding protein, partial [Acidimicrobiia bacterium]|nr:BMP family ABC transporter substrate-binding protein [Acidimicrobiia bacterium]